MVKQDRTWRIPVWQHVMSTRVVSCSAPSATTKMSEVKCFNSYAQLSMDDSDHVEASDDDQAAEDTTNDSSNTCACDRDAHPNVALQESAGVLTNFQITSWYSKRPRYWTSLAYGLGRHGAHNRRTPG